MQATARLTALLSLFLTALSLALGTVANAEVCEAPSGNPPACQATYDWEDHFIKLTRLGNHWMPNFGDGDSMSLPFRLDQGTSFPFGSDGFHETWYISRDQIPNTAPFYRVYSSLLSDHMDDKNSNPAPSLGYTQELVHGYAFTTSEPGTAPISRYVDWSISDHQTWLPNSTPSGYTLGAAWTDRRGYPRFGNKLDQCSVKTAGLAAGNTRQNSVFQMRLNAIWGNAVGEITYLPTGEQLVSHTVGDMVNTAIFYGGASCNGTLMQLNPTQSGGADCADYGNTRRWAGSPVISTSSGGTSQQWFETITKPLNFCHDDFVGTDAWSPLLWRGLFRVRTTLGCKIGVTNRDDVIRQLFEAKKDASAPFTNNPLNLANGGWFRLGVFGDCNAKNIKVDVVNMTSGTVESTHFPGCNEAVSLTNPGNKAFRITNAAGTFSLGLGWLQTASKANITFRCQGSCPFGSQKLVWEVFKFFNINSSTWKGYDVYITAGSPSTVLTRLGEIGTDNASCTT